MQSNRADVKHLAAQPGSMAEIEPLPEDSQDEQGCRHPQRVDTQQQCSVHRICAGGGNMIFLTVLCLYLIGDGLRDALDPRLKAET